MEQDIFYRGQVLEFESQQDEKMISNRYILAECNEDGFVFQIICINGYNAGTLCGYIKEDELISITHKGISKDHLIKELSRNFFNVQNLELIN